MSSSGITPINSGPLILRTYLNSSSNNTYAVGPYDDPVPANRILVTSTGGLVVPSDTITVSSLLVSTLLGPPGSAWSDYLFWNNAASPPSWQVGSTQVHLGSGAGETNQGAESIAIGHLAGKLNQAANSIVINATGLTLNNTTSNSCKIAPIRGPVTTTNPLYYDVGTQEVVYGTSQKAVASRSSYATQIANAFGVATVIDFDGQQNITPVGITYAVAPAYSFTFSNAGTYHITLTINCALIIPTQAAEIVVWIKTNGNNLGTPYTAWSQYISTAQGSDWNAITVQWCLTFAANDYIQFVMSSNPSGRIQTIPYVAGGPPPPASVSATVTIVQLG